jgi:hypothetical protein
MVFSPTQKKLLECPEPQPPKPPFHEMSREKHLLPQYHQYHQLFKRQYWNFVRRVQTQSLSKRFGLLHSLQTKCTPNHGQFIFASCCTAPVIAHRVR